MRGEVRQADVEHRVGHSREHPTVKRAICSPSVTASVRPTAVAGVPAIQPGATPIARRQDPTRFRSEGSTDAVARGQLMRWRALVPMPSYRPISDAAPGTTFGNHRANSPRHVRTSPGMTFAVQLYELTPRAATRSLSLFALQARGRWFEPSCAHQVFAARWPF